MKRWQIRPFSPHFPLKKNNMRITREFLLKSARTHAAQKAYTDRSIICIYLTGSLLRDEPLLGGTTDIDLICVHSSEPKVKREVIRLSDDIHLDLAHYSMSLFDQPRRLRADPWLGAHMIVDSKMLHDARHWFEFTQASVASKFYAPETILDRIRPMAETARTAWMEMSHIDEIDLTVLNRYIKTIETIGNALACFSGPPLTERRFWIDYPGRLNAIKAPAFASYLANLFMPEKSPSEQDWQTWMKDWGEALDSVGRHSGVPVKLHPCRRHYYIRAADYLKKDHPQAALWIMVRTWLLSGAQMRSNSRLFKPLSSFCESIGYTPTAFNERLQAMDQMLDGLEEFIDFYAQQNGVIST